MLDAWNGYHSDTIREEDRHMTAFCTMWGIYRYRSAPQGYVANGDAFTHRYDKITIGVRDIKRVIDNTLSWHRTWRGLSYRLQIISCWWARMGSC